MVVSMNTNNRPKKQKSSWQSVEAGGQENTNRYHTYRYVAGKAEVVAAVYEHDTRAGRWRF